MTRFELDFTLTQGSVTIEIAVATEARAIALFGPSGSGKTSVLEAIAGLRAPGRGRIAIDGRVLLDRSTGTNLPPRHRRIGYVPQDVLLFPHLDVRGNVMYGQRRSGPPRGGPHTAGDPHTDASLTELLELSHLMDRRVASLSGGERQRVALARALHSGPDLLLLDEPLAAVDRPRRDRITAALLRIRDDLGVPIVYVTHAPDEAAALTDYAIVMADGRVVAAGSPGEDSERHETVAAPLRRLTRWVGRAVYRAPGELGQCPACGSPRLAALGTQKLPAALEGRRTGLISGCEECGLVFVNPFPSAAELASMYAPDGEWAKGRADETLTPAHQADEAGGTGRWARLFDPVRDRLDVTHPPAGAQVLDFGCGRGKFLDVLRRCGWETFGIEPAMDVAFVRHRRLDRIPSEPLFDLVIANHVLEHMTDPLTILRQLAAATRPGGHLLVGVPRLDTLPIHRDRSYVISRVHVTAYTSAAMLTLLGRAGWQAVEPPADEVPLSGGRRTTARLRVLARRVADSPPGPHRPLDAARVALRDFSRQRGGRSMAERLGGARLAARAIEFKRRMRRWANVAGAIVGSRRRRPPHR